MEAHYVLTPPHRIERREGVLRSPLPVDDQVPPGYGAVAAAAALLSDATGKPAGEAVARAFAREVLTPHDATRRLVIAVREVVAWRVEREPELADEEPLPPRWAVPQMLARVDRELDGGPRAGWLSVYRTIHPAPDVGD